MDVFISIFGLGFNIFLSNVVTELLMFLEETPFLSEGANICHIST